MRDDRLRISVDDCYIKALGRATYVFAILEWNAVWCCERMEAGYIQKLERKNAAGKIVGKTAGCIAKDLVRLASQRPDPQDQRDCSGPAHRFKRLVETRNGIMHGKPGTAPSGEQRLFRDGDAWTPEMVDDAADEFAACSLLLHALLYNQLK